MTLFRYPGGKSRIASQLALFFKDEPQFADVFAGGGSVFIEYLKRSCALPARIVYINDLDYGVSSFWRCLFDNKLRTDLFTSRAVRLRHSCRRYKAPKNA